MHEYARISTNFFFVRGTFAQYIEYQIIIIFFVRKYSRTKIFHILTKYVCQKS